MILFIANKINKTTECNSTEQAITTWNNNGEFRALNGSSAAGKIGDDAKISKLNCDRTVTIYFVHCDFYIRLQDGIRG